MRSFTDSAADMVRNVGVHDSVRIKVMKLVKMRHMKSSNFDGDISCSLMKWCFFGGSYTCVEHELCRTLACLLILSVLYFSLSFDFVAFIRFKSCIYKQKIGGNERERERNENRFLIRYEMEGCLRCVASILYILIIPDVLMIDVNARQTLVGTVQLQLLHLLWCIRSVVIDIILVSRAVDKCESRGGSINALKHKYLTLEASNSWTNAREIIGDKLKRGTKRNVTDEQRCIHVMGIFGSISMWDCPSLMSANRWTIHFETINFTTTMLTTDLHISLDSLYSLLPTMGPFAWRFIRWMGAQPFSLREWEKFAPDFFYTQQKEKS